MGRYLVLAPADGDDESLFEELGRLAAGEASRFHVVVPRKPGGSGAGDTHAEQRLGAVIEALMARGLDADGELGEVSVMGSVARAAERTHYDALVIPVTATRVVDTIDLDVARRLHQIDVPELLLVSPRRRRPPGDAGKVSAVTVRARFGTPSGLVVGALLITLLALLVGILVEAGHWGAFI